MILAADTTRFIMVFNDVGQKADFTRAKLAVKHNLFIHFSGDFFV